MHTRGHDPACACMGTHIFACQFTCVCMFACIFMFACVFVHVCMSTYFFMCAHARVHIDMCANRVCVCVCVHRGWTTYTAALFDHMATCPLSTASWTVALFSRSPTTASVTSDGHSAESPGPVSGRGREEAKDEGGKGGGLGQEKGLAPVPFTGVMKGRGKEKDGRGGRRVEVEDRRRLELPMDI